MKIVFIGDISLEKKCGNLNPIHPCFKTSHVIGNLEGPIVTDATSKGLRAVSLFSKEVVLDIIKHFNIDALCLGNNHIFDVENGFSQTISVLQKNKLKYFGASENIESARLPLVIESDGSLCKIFSFGWNVIGCKRAGCREAGINEFSVDNTLRTIKNLRKNDKKSLVIYMVHWNYELELYPQPAHRQLAYDLISEGVDAIVGPHPHVAQGAEIKNGKPIIYSIGNWFFPPRKINNLNLKFPENAKLELAIELDFEGRECRDVAFHWHIFNTDKNQVEYETTEGWDGKRVKSLSPFRSIDCEEYYRWFKKNRLRRKGLPIYGNYKKKINNRFADMWVLFRQKIINIMLRFKIKKELSR
jgi:poly-gamma-glutamate synthesis protein (capsule biosynthesis protein)